MSRQFFILAIAIAFLYWLASGSKHDEVESRQHMPSEGSTFHGYECTDDCSGHEAGYDWSEEHGITDGDDCDTAGEHSNSPSFAEGCHAYIGDDGLKSDDTEGPVSRGDDASGDEDDN